MVSQVNEKPNNGAWYFAKCVFRPTVFFPVVVKARMFVCVTVFQSHCKMLKCFRSKLSENFQKNLLCFSKHNSYDGLKKNTKHS